MSIIILDREHDEAEIYIADAVAISLDGRDSERDDSEAALKSCDLIREAVGVLAAALSRSGALTADDLRAILHYRFEVVG